MDAAAVAREGEVQWNIDPSHTSIDLSVRHMGLFTVRGSLGHVSGTVTTQNGKLAGVQASIEAATINTGNTDRDNHLRSGDFLNTAEFPTIDFKSTNIQEQGSGRYSVTGDLAIHGRSHPVTIEVETMDPIKDPFGLIRAGATASGQLSRREWGLTWNQVMETGSLMVADEVKFTIDVQVVVQPPAAAAA